MRGEGRGKERERNINVREKHQSVASCMPPTRDLARNPGMCPDWELNQQYFGSQASAHPTEPCQPGLFFVFLIEVKVTEHKINHFKVASSTLVHVAQWIECQPAN